MISLNEGKNVTELLKKLKVKVVFNDSFVGFEWKDNKYEELPYKDFKTVNELFVKIIEEITYQS